MSRLLVTVEVADNERMLARSGLADAVVTYLIGKGTHGAMVTVDDLDAAFAEDES